MSPLIKILLPAKNITYALAFSKDKNKQIKVTIELDSTFSMNDYR